MRISSRFRQTLVLAVVLGTSLPALAQPAQPTAKPAAQPAKPLTAPAKPKADAPPPSGTSAPAGAPAPSTTAQPSNLPPVPSTTAQPGGAPPAPTTTAAPPPPPTTAGGGQAVAGDDKDEPLLPPSKQEPATPPPDPDKDAKQLTKQGTERPTGTAEIGARPSDVYAEDWWSQARPVFEIHGYFRVRAELFHNFALGRTDPPGTALWAQPPDNDYTESGGSGTTSHSAGGVNKGLCGPDPFNTVPCQNNTQAGANMRFRLNPELHISDNLRIMSQIDLLDNVVLGSTPEGYATTATGDVYARGGYAPIGAFATTQWAPQAGINSNTSSVSVKRVWGEYMTPVGLLRFGRMPSHWGLGMVANSGDGYDSDWQSTADRIMLVTGIKKYDLYFAAGWDFVNEGPTSARPNEQQGQAYDLSQLDDVNQYVFVLAHRRNPELQKLDLAKGNFVLNGGVYFVFRNQFLANDASGGKTGQASIGQTGQDNGTAAQGLTRRNAQAYIPDFWVQFLYKKFRFEAEAAGIIGSIEQLDSDHGPQRDPKNPTDTGYKIRQFGGVMQSEFRAIEDRLKIQLGAGYASGDPDYDTLVAPADGLKASITKDRTFSEFRFHPDYRVDMILFRNILQRIQGAYYFRPSVDYDFQRDKNGQRLGGGAALIWSRAAEFIQTPGHARDLGLELNFQLYFQSRDGALNDDPDKMGGFFTSFNYGVMFPLAGLGYLPKQVSDFQAKNAGATLETKTAQALRWYMGILF